LKRFVHIDQPRPKSFGDGIQDLMPRDDAGYNRQAKSPAISQTRKDMEFHGLYSRAR
jgi:hypothetical protein